MYRSIFVGLRVEPDADMAASLRETVLAPLQGRSASIEDFSNLHITVCFLGKAHVPDAMRLFNQGCETLDLEGSGPLFLDFHRVAAFGSAKQAVKVIYAEPTPAERLSKIMAAFAGKGSDAYREQKPHVTVARLGSIIDSQWAVSALVGSPLRGQGRVDGVCLLANDGSGLYRTLAFKSF